MTTQKALEFERVIDRLLILLMAQKIIDKVEVGQSQLIGLTSTARQLRNSPTKTSRVDALVIKDNKKVTIDAKFYSTKIPTKEVEKLLRDQKLHQAVGSILVLPPTASFGKSAYELAIRHCISIIVFIEGGKKLKEANLSELPQFQNEENLAFLKNSVEFQLGKPLKPKILINKNGSLSKKSLSWANGDFIENEKGIMECINKERELVLAIKFNNDGTIDKNCEAQKIQEEQKIIKSKLKAPFSNQIQKESQHKFKEVEKKSVENEISIVKIEKIEYPNENTEQCGEEQTKIENNEIETNSIENKSLKGTESNPLNEIKKDEQVEIIHIDTTISSINSALQACKNNQSEIEKQNNNQSEIEKQIIKQSEIANQNTNQSEIANQNMNQSEITRQIANQSAITNQNMNHSEITSQNIKIIDHTEIEKQSTNQSEIEKQSTNQSEIAKQNINQSEITKDKKLRKNGKPDMRQKVNWKNSEESENKKPKSKKKKEDFL